MSFTSGIQAGFGLGPLSEVATTVCAANGWEDMGKRRPVAGAAKILAAWAVMGVYRKICRDAVIDTLEQLGNVKSDKWPLSQPLLFCIPMIATAGLVFAVGRHLFRRLFTPSNQLGGAPGQGSIRTAPSTRT